VIGVASHCNISCGFCSGPMGSYGELTERRLDEVMAQLPTLMNLSVVGPGEPLMSKLFPRLLEHINDTGYPSLHVSMTTNGTLMTRGWLARHRNVRLGHIRISLNAGSAATHERMTGKRFFDRLLDNIDALAERKRLSDARFELTLSCVLSEYVLGDLMNFAEIVDRANANVVVEPMYGNALGLSPYVKADRLRALRDECRAVSDAFAVRNPKVARAFRAMEQFAQGRLQRRHLAVLPQHTRRLGLPGGPGRGGVEGLHVLGVACQPLADVGAGGIDVAVQRVLHLAGLVAASQPDQGHQQGHHQQHQHAPKNAAGGAAVELRQARSRQVGGDGTSARDGTRVLARA
jgi:pyruvate-formate lyase-activating enzyme